MGEGKNIKYKTKMKHTNLVQCTVLDSTATNTLN